MFFMCSTHFLFFPIFVSFSFPYHTCPRCSSRHPIIHKFYYLHVFSYNSFMYNDYSSPLVSILPTMSYRMYSISLYCTLTIFVVIVHLLYLLQPLSFFLFSYRTCPRCSSRQPSHFYFP